MYSLWDSLTVRGWCSPNFPVGKSVGKHMTSRYCWRLSMGSSLTLSNLYCSVSESVDNLLSKFRMVKAWKPWISSALALSSIVLLAFLTTSITFVAASSTDASSTSTYNQLVCFSVCMALFTAFTSTKVRQTVLLLVGLPFTMINNSGFGKAVFTSLVGCTWSRVSSVLFNGSGRKNMVPLQALRELYTGTLPVYVPSLTTVW